MANIEEMAKLFTPYFRGMSAVWTSGTGPGLYIVKNLLDRIAGKIEVRSVAEGGTRVIVSLPRAPRS